MDQVGFFINTLIPCINRYTKVKPLIVRHVQKKRVAKSSDIEQLLSDIEQVKQLYECLKSLPEAKWGKICPFPPKNRRKAGRHPGLPAAIGYPPKLIDKPGHSLDQ